MIRVALVTPGFADGGGVRTMTLFLHRVLAQSGRFAPEVISMAASARDRASVHLWRPASWWRGLDVVESECLAVPYRHVGGYFTEFEFQRYQPRRALETVLEPCRLIQFVVGFPSWAYAANSTPQPWLLWTATTMWPDRVTRVRGFGTPRRLWSLAMSRLAGAYERQVLARARFVFALSDYTLKSIEPWAAPGRTGLAVCGVDTDLFRPGGAAPRSYILSVARFSDPRKNVRLLLEALELLASRRRVPDLYLAGELPGPDVLRWLSTLKIASQVRFLGVVHGEELARLYREARFLVVSSDEEGLGIVILEAMASGLPVISTRCGGPETCILPGHTGYLTPVGDAAALASAMERLLDDAALCARLGEAARQRVEERFSLRVAGRVFLEKYDELLR